MERQLNKCIWMWAGLLTYRLCDREYQCAGCPVEALFHPEAASRPETEPAGERTGDRIAERTAFAADRFHDPQHLWLRVLPEGHVQIGLDPMASRLLSAAAGIETPRPGTRLHAGEKAASVLLPAGEISFASPVTGEVVRVHEVQPKRIRSMTSRPYSRAWLFVMSVSRLERQLTRFLFGRSAWLRLSQDWSRFREECVGLAAASSGVNGQTPSGGAPVAGHAGAAFSGVAGGGPHPPRIAAALPDGGELDLDRLVDWAGPRYASIIRPWIGAERLRVGRPRIVIPEVEPGKPGSGSSQPEER